jgi:hypothetical protein
LEGGPCDETKVKSSGEADQSYIGQIRETGQPRWRSGEDAGADQGNPGIRPSEINRRLKRVESDGLRATLIKRGLIRKEKDGSAMRYYPV